MYYFYMVRIWEFVPFFFFFKNAKKFKVFFIIIKSGFWIFIIFYMVRPNYGAHKMTNPPYEGNKFEQLGFSSPSWIHSFKSLKWVIRPGSGLLQK